MVSLIQTWTSPVDPGGGNPGRGYNGPLIGAGWTHLRAIFAVTGGWSGNAGTSGSAHTSVWFNRYPQPASPFVELAPDQPYVTDATDMMFVATNNSAAGMQATVTLEGDFVGAGVPCQYGTELKPGGQFVYYLTPALIDVWLTTQGLVWLAPLFTALWFSTLRADELCSAGPPALPVIDLDTLVSSPDTQLQILKAVAWVNLCQCVAGSPAPIPFPSPSAPQPPGWPALPTSPCSNADLCAAVQDLQHQLGAIQSALRSNLELTTFLQRYKLPFAYITGATHSHLVGVGTFNIPRLVGLTIDITSPPTGGTVKGGNPPYIYDQGWVSISTPDGMLAERRIAQASRSWFPAEMPTATQFSWYLQPGVEISVAELEAEP